MAVVPLKRYQHRWLSDRSQLKLLTKSRRIGGSFIVTLEDAMEAVGYGYDNYGKPYYRPERGVDQFLISASENQAQELLAECRVHIDGMSAALGRNLFQGDPGVERIRLRNGRKLVALSANPRTARGFTGSVTLDELAHIPRGREIWTGVFPITRPNLKRRYGYKLRALTSTNGDDNIHYDLLTKDIGAMVSKHQITIHDAVADGFPIDVEKLRLEVGDPDAFAQEYECAILSANSRYISAESYDACVYYPEDAASEMPSGGHRTWYAGMDVGRKSDGDPSVITTLQRIGDTNWQMECESRRGAGWEDQEAWVAETLRRSQRIAIDVTGMGDQFGERLVKQFGARIDPVQFTVKTKEMLATGLKLAIERKKIRLRADDIELRRDVLALRRHVTSHGNVTFEAERTKTGHADRAWALALAVHTASGPDSSNVKVTVVGSRASNQLNKF